VPALERQGRRSGRSATQGDRHHPQDGQDRPQSTRRLAGHPFSPCRRGKDRPGSVCQCSDGQVPTPAPAGCQSSAPWSSARDRAPGIEPGLEGSRAVRLRGPSCSSRSLSRQATCNGLTRVWRAGGYRPAGDPAAV